VTVPIVTVHGGDVSPNADESYVGIGAQQALRYNSRFILLGGPRNRHLGEIEGVEWYNYLADYSQQATYFVKHAYRKFSFYSDLYNLAVMKRYFVLSEFMAAHKIDRVFSVDSDTMIYCDVEREAITFEVGDVAFCIPQNQTPQRLSASSHFSYFTQKGIVDFCQFMIDDYINASARARLEAKWAWHQQHEKPGGVCDMTHLYLYSLVRDVTNLSKVVEGTAFDHHVNTPENYWPDEYRMGESRKEIVWKDHQPHGHNERIGKLVRFAGLHLQGGAKRLAQSYMRARAQSY